MDEDLQGALNSGSNILGNLLTLLGGNNWAIQDAQYCGITFATVSNDFLANLEQVIQSGLEVFGSGMFDTLPYGTFVALQDTSETISRKLIEFQIPNLQGSYIEDLGYSGSKFTFNTVIAGRYYERVINRIRYAMTNDFMLAQDPIQFINAVDVSGGSLPANFNATPYQLVHPDYGIIPGNTYLKDIEVIFRSDNWRGAFVRLTFWCETPANQQPTAIPTDITTTIFNTLAAAGTILGALGTAYQTGLAINSTYLRNL